MRTFIVFAALLVMQGCAQNPYQKFYSPRQGEFPGDFEVSGPPRLIQGSDIEGDRLRLAEDGYIPIGHSSFNGGNVDQRGALEQAAAAGAAIAVVYSKYRNTVSGAMPLTLPSTQMSTTNISGMSGSRSFYGTGTTTTYGSNTTYIPYSVDRSDYLAIYCKKAGPTPFGVGVREPQADERRAIGTNAGLVIDVVRKGSPAFNADLFRGDVLMRIGDTELRDISGFQDAVRRHQGQSTPIVVIRDGKTIQKTVDVGRF